MDSVYYFCSRLQYAVKFQDAELMQKLQNHPKRLEAVWRPMKKQYDHDIQLNPVSPSQKEWWAEYKRNNPRFA